MLRFLPLVVALLATPTLAAEPVDLSEPSMMEWAGDAAEQVFVAGDVTMTLTISGDEAERLATLKVEKPGTDAVELSGIGSSIGYGRVGVFPFDESGGRSVIFAVYSGGAHCCMQIVTATETADGWVTDAVGSVDGDSVWLEDLDGDGIFEMPLFDGRFAYTFDAYAFSYPPQQVIKSKDGVSYDASADPKWRSFFETQLGERRGDCSGETWNLGVCAGLLGVAARLGTYDEELALVAAALEAGKRTSGWDDFIVCIDIACSATEKVTDFDAAIDRSLRAWGYLPAR
jgi:hypothetical protein